LVAKVEIGDKKENGMREGDFCSVKVKKTGKEKCIRC